MKNHEADALNKSPKISPPATRKMPMLQRRQYHLSRSRQASSTSRAIPMPRAHVPRTESEIRLGENETTAEWRDLCMFYRVANGIRDRQQEVSGVQHDDVVRVNESTDNTAGRRCFEPIDISPAVIENSGGSNIMAVHHSSVLSTYGHHGEHSRTTTTSGYLPQICDPSSLVGAENNSWSLSGFHDGGQDQVIQFPILLGGIRTLGRERSSTSAAFYSSSMKVARKNLAKQESEECDGGSSPPEEVCAFFMDDI